MGDRGSLSRAWQWKLDLQTGSKTKFDLYKELGRAPGAQIYLPGPVQLAAHESEEKTKQVVGGWRAGKSKWLAAELLPYLFKDDAQVWIVGNDYKLARYEFEYIRNWLRWLDAPFVTDSHPETGPWSFRLAWGAKLETQTADSEEKIEGGNLDAAGIAEAGQMRQKILDKLRGRVAEKRGPVLMAGSLEASEPWYMDTYEQFIGGRTEEKSWASFGIPSWENSIIFPGGREDEAIKEWESTLTDDQFKLKVCAQVAKPEELVFGEFDRKLHVVNFEFSDVDKDGFVVEYPEPIMDALGFKVIGWRLPERGPIHLAIDPGYNGAYAVLFIRKYDDQVFVVDEVYMKQFTVEDVIAECKNRQWWPDVTMAIMDIAGKQHPGMKSHLEIWGEEHNLGFKPNTAYVHISDGIQRVRTFLRNPQDRKPRLWVARECEGLIAEMGLHRYRMNKPNRPVKEEPIDADNHSIKALAYYLMDRFGPLVGGRGKTTSQSYIKNTIDNGFAPLKRRAVTIEDWAFSDD